MKKIIILILFLLILLVVFLNFVESKSDDNILRIINNSEIKDRIETVKTKINDYKKINSKNQYVNSFSINYDKEMIIYEIKKSIKDNFNKSEINQLNNWYESELGKKIKYLNNTNITKELAVKIINDIEPLKNKERLIRIFEINKIHKYSYFDYRLFSYIVEKSKLYMENMDLTENKMRNQTIAFLMYKYQTLSLEELDEYLNFLESNLAVKFINLYKTSLENSLIDTFEVSYKG